MGLLRELFGRRPTAPVPERVIEFRQNDDFFEFACKFLDCQPAVDKTVVAQVVEAMRQPSGERQAVLMRVPTGPEPLRAVALTCGRRGPDLHTGDLVLWRIVSENQQPANPLQHWVGVVFASIHPVISKSGEWRIKADYPFDGE